MTRLIPLVLALSAPAFAAAPTPPPPADLFAVVDVAAPKLELPEWVKVVDRFAPGTPMPPPESIGTWLGKLVGVPSIDGVDPAKPLHLALVNPQAHPQPLVLVVPVKDAKALVASLKSTQLEAHLAAGEAVIGAKATLAQLEKAIVVATRTQPDHGLHAVAFVPPIWAVYGPQLKGLLAVLTQGQGATGGLQQAIGKTGALLTSALDQSERLRIELSAAGGTPELLVTLDAQPGSAMAGVFAAQKPSDFSLLSRLPVQKAPPLVIAGYLDLKTTAGWMSELMSSNEVDAKTMHGLFDEMATVLTGEIAMLGQLGAQPDSDMLMRVTDPKRALELWPRFYDVLARSNVFGTKMTFKTRPGTRIGSIPVKRSETAYDFSKLPGYKGPPKVKAELVQAGWDDVLAAVTGKNALDRLKKIITVSRAQPPAALDPALQADVDKARGAQDSLFTRIDLAKAAPDTKTSLPPGTTVILRAGFGATSGRLRFVLGQIPSSTGTSATSVNTPK